MIKNIVIYLILFTLFIGIIISKEKYKKKYTKKISKKYTKKSITNDKMKEYGNNIKDGYKKISNYAMNDKSIILSSNTNLTKDQCLKKINGKDINGASYYLSNNKCVLYHFAEKGVEDDNIESVIFDNK